MPFDLSPIRIFLAHNAWNWSSSRQRHVKLRIQDLLVNCPPMAKLKGSSPKRHILFTKKITDIQKPIVSSIQKMLEYRFYQCAASQIHIPLVSSKNILLAITSLVS